MPYSSAQISGMVGGQMAMFANQHAYSQQISTIHGTGPQMPMGGMSNPFPSSPSYAGADASPDYGSGMAATMGGALPAAMGGASLAGGFIGGAAGWADPMTGMYRGFMAGAGGTGHALQGAGHVMSQAYTGARGAGGFSGMARGAMAAGRSLPGALSGVSAMGVAGGLGAAAATGGLYYAATAPIIEGAQQFSAGAQNVADVGMMANQHMGPQFGQAGARPGGSMGRSQIKGMVNVLEELQGDDMMVTMDSLKRLMDQAGQAGMLQGIGDAQQFKQKFGGMVKSMKQIAQVMGTSIEEAAPLFSQMKGMGLWSTSDIMGTSGALKAAGPAAAPEMMATMQSGARLSHAMGGRLGAGAAMGRDMFSQVQAARSSGAMSQEQLMEYTGGVGGVRGQRMVAQSMQGVMGRFSESSMGRLMMAGLGKFEGGKFTGGIDSKMMDRFTSGDIDVGELQKIGQKRSNSSREAATSFMVRKGAIGQEMMAKGGMEGLSSAIGQVMKRSGYGDAGENIQNMFIQKMTGADARTAEMIRNLSEKMPQIQAEKQRKLEATLEAQFREADIKMNHSWDGFGKAMDQSSEDLYKPIRELGAEVATSFNRSIDRASDWYWNRTKKFTMSSQARTRVLREQGLAKQSGGLQLSSAEHAGLESTSTTERMRNMGGGMGGGAIPIVGNAPAAMLAGALGMSIGSNTDQLSRLGAETKFGARPAGEGWVSAGKTMPIIGMEKWVQTGNKTEVIKQAIARSEDRSWGGLGFEGKQTKNDNANIETAQKGLRKIFGDPRFAAAWGDVRKSKKQPKEQTQAIMAHLKVSDPEAYRALQEISKKSGSGETDMGEMDAVALAIGDMESNIDWDKGKEDATNMGLMTTPEAHDKAIGEILAGAATSGTPYGDRTDEGVRSALEEAVQNEDWGADAAEYYKGTEDPKTNKFRLALSRGETSAQEFSKKMEDEMNSGRITKARIGDALGKSISIMGQKARMEARQRIGGMARAQGRELKAGRIGAGLGEGTRGELEELLNVYSGKGFSEGQAGVTGRAAELVESLSRTKGGERSALRDSGGIGAFAASIGRGADKLGGLKSGSSMEDITAITGALPAEMQSKIQGMIKSKGGLDKEEISGIQEMYRKAASKGGPGAGKSSASSMTELLTKYTEANTKFVFAVGASISGIDKKDLNAVAEEMKVNLSKQSNDNKKPEGD